MRRLQPDSSDDVAFDRARELIGQEEYEKAASILRPLATIYLLEPRILGLLGHCEYRTGSTDAAIEHLRSAASLNPQNELWSSGLVAALLKAGFESQAKEEVVRYFSQGDYRSPDYLAVLRELGREEWVPAPGA